MYPSEPVVCGQYGKTNVLDSWRDSLDS
jgi:hypothetical protein